MEGLLFLSIASGHIWRSVTSRSFCALHSWSLCAEVESCQGVQTSWCFGLLMKPLCASLRNTQISESVCSYRYVITILDSPSVGMLPVLRDSCLHSGILSPVSWSPKSQCLCAVKYIPDSVDTENLTQLYFPGEMWFPKLMPYDLGRGIKIVFTVIWVVVFKISASSCPWWVFGLQPQ